MSTSKHVHLIGICGTAMASLAAHVAPARLHRPRLRHGRVSSHVRFPRRARHPGGPALRRRKSGPAVPIWWWWATPSRAATRNWSAFWTSAFRSSRWPRCCTTQFLRGHEVLAVAGTHGKTTTTSMLAWIFESAGERPSFLVGGIAENFGASFKLDDGRSFIIEADEYDTAFFDKGPKFLHYFPDAVILTSVEFDHADIYRDLDSVKTAFKRLVNLVPRRGRIIAWDGARTWTNASRAPFARSSVTALPSHRTGASPACATPPSAPVGRVLARRPSSGRSWSSRLAASTTCSMPPPPRPWRPPAASMRRDRAGAAHLSERQAPAGGDGRGRRRHHHRRFCPSSHRDCGNAAGLAHALSWTPPVGRAGAALQYASPQRLPAGAGGEPVAGGSK